MKNNYEKLVSSLRYWVQGKEWFEVAKAIEYACKLHTGFRKDNVTKEFEHQIFQTHMVRTYHKNLVLPKETMMVALLHDVREDYDISNEEIENLFGLDVARGVESMTKVFNKIKKDTIIYFEELSKCPMGSICKGTDRVHNQASMDGVFKLEKQNTALGQFFVG